MNAGKRVGAREKSRTGPSPRPRFLVLPQVATFRKTSTSSGKNAARVG